MKKVLLYSGGLDSWLINQIWKPDLLIYVDMGTEYTEIEKSRLPKDVLITSLPLSQFSLENSIIPLRNLYLYMIACNLTKFDDVEICLGAVEGDRINDKTQLFADKLNDLLKYLYADQPNQPTKLVKISMPFLEYSKLDLLLKYKELGGDLHTAYNETFSCYHPTIDNKPCMRCRACFRKVCPFILAGYEFEDFHKKIIKDFFYENVLPRMSYYIADNSKAGLERLTAFEIIKSW